MTSKACTINAGEITFTAAAVIGPIMPSTGKASLLFRVLTARCRSLIPVCVPTLTAMLKTLAATDGDRIRSNFPGCQKKDQYSSVASSCA